MATPSTNGVNGGRFQKGNAGGPGNPHAAAVAGLRSALLGAVGTSEIEAVIKKLVELATEGNVAAAREVLDRTLGRVQDALLIQRLERLEELAAAMKPQQEAQA